VKEESFGSAWKQAITFEPKYCSLYGQALPLMDLPLDLSNSSGLGANYHQCV